MVSKSTYFLAKRLGLVAAGLAVGLTIAEGLLAMMPPMGPEFILAATTGSFDNTLFKDDVALRVVLAPNVDTPNFKTNALGVRGPGLLPKKEGERRVLAVGDSFTLGLAVDQDQSFSARLSETLGQNTTLYNAGVPGYGTQQATGLMRRLVPHIQPDLVLLTVYTGNDLRDNARWVKSPGLPTTPPPLVSPPPPARSRIWVIGAKYSRIVAYSLMFIDLSAASSDFRIQEFKDEILPFADPKHLSPLIPPTRAALHRFANSCLALKVRCAIALVPPAFVVHTNRQAATFEAFNIKANPAQIDIPNQMIESLVPSSVPVIDLATALRESLDEGPYLVFDPHFSAQGHDIAARALTPFIAKLLDIN